ncbi:hypothetical protein CN445_28375 [Bacillus cereus]|nr:hypothetical protein CN445_28375 [Bacillus cereus]PFN65865.1 hypothetical protein COJ62_25835 [Bacillus cereus]
MNQLKILRACFNQSFLKYALFYGNPLQKWGGRNIPFLGENLILNGLKLNNEMTLLYDGNKKDTLVSV